MKRLLAMRQWSIEVVEARQQIINGANMNQQRNAEMMITRTTQRTSCHTKGGGFYYCCGAQRRSTGPCYTKNTWSYTKWLFTEGVIDRKFRVENIGKYNGKIGLNLEHITLRNAAIFFNNNYRNLGRKQNLTAKKSGFNTQSCNCKAGNCLNDNRSKCY